MVEPAGPSRHRSAGRHRPRPVPVVAAGVTAAVVVGAVTLVAVVRGGHGPAPAPRSADRAAGVVTGSPSAAGPGRTPAGAPARTPVGRQSVPVAAGTLRAAPPTGPAPSPTTASRDRRPAPSAAPTARTAGGATRSGRATFYTLTGLPNCGYPDAAATGTYLALSPADFGGSAACGTVFDVTGPKGTVRVTVADQCPECGAGHLDLAPAAFARIADPVAGIVPITFARVVDPPTGGPVRIRVKEGSSPYWLALLPIDTGNPVASVAVLAGGSWRPLQRTGYGYWVAAAGAGPGPYRVRLVDDRGHTAAVSVPLRAGATVSAGARLY